MGHATTYTAVDAYEWLVKCECGWMKRVGGKIDAVIAECDMHQFENGPSAADRAADITAERDQLRAEVERLLANLTQSILRHHAAIARAEAAPEVGA